MTRHRVMHLGETYTIEEYSNGEWVKVGELPTLNQAKELLKDIRKIKLA